MNAIQQQLIDQARRQYGRIYPCGKKTDLSECFTEELGELQLWFNTDDNNTRMISSDSAIHP